MINTEKIQPTGKVIPKIMRVGIYFGKPMNFKDYGDPADPFVLRSITDSIMKEIQSLSGQEYVDIYATRAKELLQKGEEIDEESE
jgi:1-acyl-sn-glycerol-3-phosphate acyltransferase